MSDFMELCLRRQSCRNFADRPVEHEKLVRCVEAARLAPSGCNGQPWSFVVAQNPDIVSELAKCAQQLGLNSYISGANAFFVILEEHANLMPQLKCIVDSQYFAPGDIGAAAAYLCLEAESQGIGTCVLGVYNREKISSLLDIPQEKKIRFLIAAGYPADIAVRQKARKPLEDIILFIP
ncbi:nitroreductase family protein [Clostridium arbusti]|jgi:nitroreductase|uniref:nitroreductase family protein n=1 Tax=Clostridium arbusti TaxID=1137848 RepID=UPI000287EC91|nr:nitroreductase family protein [Clostridium arbusti]